ncbi:MAG: alanine racemase [Proteobacteria bacterium]|nr:alanine racemase [Pseudomonadota bacterium]MBU1742515.1 alanine racemase [Pseudomonadota bacterium]
MDAHDRSEPVRSTRAVIDLGAIAHNVGQVRRAIGPDRGLMAVVKADGYGHGAPQVARTALDSGATCLGVALPEEGAALRRAGIEAPIVVLGLIRPEEAAKTLAAGLEQAVDSLDLAEALSRVAGRTGGRARVHLKVDTGMGRIGVPPREAVPLLRTLRATPSLEVAGIFSHLSSADEADKSYTRRQVDAFDGLLRQIERAGLEVPTRHLANSAAVLDLPETYYDLVRPGIMIYGLYPSAEVGRTIRLRPAMTFQTRVSAVKRVGPGMSLSYGRTFVADREATMATLPVGYADGYSRRLSNRGEVLIHGRRAPVVGRVCMDMILADVTDLPSVRPGDDVVLFGPNLGVDEIADKVGTINYEVVCGVSRRVPRIYASGLTAFREDRKTWLPS